MSRSGYSHDWPEDNSSHLYRGAVASAFRGKRGQAFLKEMLAALDAMPEKRLLYHEIEKDGAVCAIGSVGKARGIDMSKIDPEDYYTVARTFGIAAAMAQEIVYINDEGAWGNETPEQRWVRMRKWVEGSIHKWETICT